MKLELPTERSWKFSHNCCADFLIGQIEEILGVINRAGQGDYFIVDYFKQRLVVCPSADSMVTGFSKDIIRKEGFNFYDRILSESERDWLSKMHRSAFKIFFDLPIDRRKDLEFFYDLVSTTSSGTEQILFHKLVPLRLDENGKMHLGLCFVAPATSLHDPTKASIVDVKTSEKYNFIDNKFKLSTTKFLTPEELKILKWMSQDVSAEKMCLELNISTSSLSRKKTRIYRLLGVKGATGAIYKANLLGLI